MHCTMLAAFRSVFVFVFALGAGWSLAAEQSPTPAGMRPTITRQEVWQAVGSELRERGVPEAEMPRIEDLELPVALPAVAGRKLRVSSACWDEGPQRTQFRLACSEPGQCLPFLVYLHVHEAEAANRDAGARAGLCRQDSESRTARVATLPPPAKPMLRAGDRATAVSVSSRLRISTSVTCLDRGSEGEIIRVRNEDGQVFRARISGPALLEAVPQ